MNRLNRNGWMDTLPSFRADAGEALVVFRLLTYSTVFAGSGAAGRQQGLTVFTWWKRRENIYGYGAAASDLKIKHQVAKLILTVSCFQTPVRDFIFKSDINPSLHPTSLSISMTT